MKEEAMKLDLEITEHTKYSSLLELVLPVYSTVYAEPPYYEGSDDVRQFISLWESQIESPDFRLILAHVDSSVIGFTFGFPLRPESSWWSGLLDPVDEDLIREYPGRTFAIIELAVLAQYRSIGIGGMLHNKLLEGRPEERVTLLSRVDATPARTAYSSWGYHDVGHVQPGKDAPVYMAMVRELPFKPK